MESASDFCLSEPIFLFNVYMMKKNYSRIIIFEYIYVFFLEIDICIYIYINTYFYLVYGSRDWELGVIFFAEPIIMGSIVYRKINKQA